MWHNAESIHVLQHMQPFHCLLLHFHEIEGTYWKTDFTKLAQNFSSRGRFDLNPVMQQNFIKPFLPDKLLDPLADL